MNVRNNYIVVMCIVAFVQFVNGLEYMIIAPIGPYLLKGYNLYSNQIGILTGAYTCSAVLSGLLGFFYLDRFDQKKTLVLNLIILGIVNYLAIFCENIYMIIVVRLIAGFFGGITVSLAMALLINRTPESFRGKASSIVMGAFPLVSILGIPSGLWITEYFGFRVLFISISLLILFGAMIMVYFIPNMEHKFNKNIHKRIQLSKKSLLAMSLFAIGQFPIYMLIPSLAILMKYNMSVSDKFLPVVFLSGGIFSFLATYISGWLTNRVGSKLLINISTVIFIVVLIGTLVIQLLPPIVFVSLLMSAVYVRLVSTIVISSKYPEPHQRSGFSALQSALNNIGATIAGLLSAYVLTVKPDLTLGNINYFIIIIVIAVVMLPIAVHFHNNALPVNNNSIAKADNV